MSRGPGRHERALLQQAAGVRTTRRLDLWISLQTAIDRILGGTPNASEYEALRRAAHSLARKGAIELRHHEQYVETYSPRFVRRRVLRTTIYLRLALSPEEQARDRALRATYQVHLNKVSSGDLSDDVRRVHSAWLSTYYAEQASDGVVLDMDD